MQTQIWGKVTNVFFYKQKLWVFDRSLDRGQQ